ncbi:hypothetical protein PDJAM_G00245870, partial [Pangasius djambal]|nr:hypothetical protein [Pangasius djambal]
ATVEEERRVQVIRKSCPASAAKIILFGRFLFDCLFGNMNVLLSVVVLAVFSASAFAKESAPKIQVYSRNPGEFGKENTLICHVSDFHPPDIEIKLMKNDRHLGGRHVNLLGFSPAGRFLFPHLQ